MEQVNVIYKWFDHQFDDNMKWEKTIMQYEIGIEPTKLVAQSKTM